MQRCIKQIQTINNYKLRIQNCVLVIGNNQGISVLMLGTMPFVLRYLFFELLSAFHFLSIIFVEIRGLILYR